MDSVKILDRTDSGLRAEIAELRARLQEADDVLGAIRSGAVDAITVDTPAGKRVSTLKGAEQPYRVMVESMSEGAVTVTPDGVILYCNQRFADMVSAPPQTVVGSSLPGRFAGDDAATIAAAIRAGQTATTRLQASLLASDATPVPVSVAMHGQSDGETRRVAIVVTDLTEVTAAQSKLRSSQERLALALKAGRAGTFDWDIRNNINHWSPEIEELYRVPQGKFGGTFEAWEGLVFPEDLAAAKAAIEASLKSGAFFCEWRVRRSDGGTMWLAASAIVLFGNDGAPERMIGVNVDITPRKAAETEVRRLNAELEQRVVERTAQLEEANKDLESFAYSVSHDLRTPLRAIDGFSRILLEDYADKLDAEGQRVLNVVRDSTVKISRLIEDVLSFSRTGRAAIQPAPVDMAALVRDTIADALAPALAERKAAIDIGELPETRGDKAMLQRVWMNLLDNARKFTAPKADARIEVGATAVDGETVYFVRDNGVGFDMQYAGKLFGVFQRLHGAEFPGTGIGLAIVKKIVTKHGGRVWAEGKVGEGATFYFTLPHTVSDHG